MKLENVNGLEIFAEKGHMENKLYIKDGNVKVPFTINSGEYENDYNEFMLDEFVNEDYKRDVNLVVNKMSKSVKKVGGFTKFTLKNKYKDQLMNL